MGVFETPSNPACEAVICECSGRPVLLTRVWDRWSQFEGLGGCAKDRDCACPFTGGLYLGKSRQVGGGPDNLRSEVSTDFFRYSRYFSER